MTIDTDSIFDVFSCENEAEAFVIALMLKAHSEETDISEIYNAKAWLTEQAFPIPDEVLASSNIKDRTEKLLEIFDREERKRRSQVVAWAGNRSKADVRHAIDAMMRPFQTFNLRTDIAAGPPGSTKLHRPVPPYQDPP